MTPQEALAEHLTMRPEMPRPFNPNLPESIAWQRAFQWWTDKKDRLECAVRVLGVSVIPERQQPACTPRADYIYREPVKRRRNAA